MATKKSGFTLIETLIGVAMLGFVIITVVAAFSQIQLNTRNLGDKNLAMLLCESSMEQLLKYPGSALTATTTTDYAFKTPDSYRVQATDPGRDNQFRRTITLTNSGNMMLIQVLVEYGNRSGNYPFRVSLNSQRGG